MTSNGVNIRMWIVNKGILKTIVYYDCLDYPLTKEELEVFSFGSEGNQIGAEIEKFDGFYFLKGRKELIEKRKKRNQIAEKKWEKTRKSVRWLQIVPYLRMVFASGSLALKNTAKESDLDVLIVVKHGRIWTVRFLTIILLSLLGVRRTRYQKIAPDKICLNHFITDKSLYIPRKSIYTAQLYARLAPVFVEDEKLVDKFTEANSWISEYVRGWPECVKKYDDMMIYHRRSQNYNSKIKTLGEKILNTKFGDWLENILKKYQLLRINNHHLTYKAGGRIKADDESLEFHPESPELKIIERYNKKIVEFGFKDLTERSSFAK